LKTFATSVFVTDIILTMRHYAASNFNQVLTVIKVTLPIMEYREYVKDFITATGGATC
jgi:hypothetical protein